MVHLDASIANLILGVVIPLVTALVVKDVASPGVKAATNAFLAALGGAITTVLAAGGALHWQAFAISIATVWGASMVSYLGLLKPTGVTGAISTSTANFGIGTAVAPAPTPQTIPSAVTAGSAWNSTAWNDAPPPSFTPAPANAGKLGDVTVWEKLTIPVALPVAPTGTSWNEKAPEAPVMPTAVTAGTSWNESLPEAPAAPERASDGVPALPIPTVFDQDAEAPVRPLPQPE